jgi:hypothetical protein
LRLIGAAQVLAFVLRAHYDVFLLSCFGVFYVMSSLCFGLGVVLSGDITQ